MQQALKTLKNTITLSHTPSHALHDAVTFSLRAPSALLSAFSGFGAYFQTGKESFRMTASIILHMVSLFESMELADVRM